MIEENRPSSEPAPAAPPSDAAAWAALNAASRDKADAFLEGQSRMVEKQQLLLDLQIEELKRELALRHWSLKFGNVSAVMKVSFEVAVAFIFIAIAVGIGAAVWTAAHDSRLVIESFSLPPDLAARGITGQAIAAELQDRLQGLQDATDTARPASTFANNWGDDIKVQIPDTGVSITEVYRALVGWLGHQTHVDGEVWRAGSNIVLTIRAGHEASATVSGPESDLPSLVERAAEAVYARTQPYRYGVYAEAHGRPIEARKLYERLSIEGATLQERAWAYIGLSNVDRTLEASAEDARRAAALLPDFALAWSDLANNDENSLGHDESAFQADRHALELIERGDAEMSARAQTISIPSLRGIIESDQGDFLAAAADFARQSLLPDWANLQEGGREAIVFSLANAWDISGARRAFAALPPASRSDLPFRIAALLQIAWQARDLRDFVASENVYQTDLRQAQIEAVKIDFADLYYPTLAANDATSNQPQLADLISDTGDFRRAHAVIDKTPLDCDFCLRVRGRIASAERRWAAAAHWFAEAAKQAPDLPFSYTDWGAMLLRAGNYDAAIAQFAAAHKYGPHFSDPLEMWGETLMQQNRSDLALAKFEEADKYAPNWGRLHLEWGKALFYAGQKDEAQKQFALASHLALSQSDTSALSRWTTRHG